MSDQPLWKRVFALASETRVEALATLAGAREITVERLADQVGVRSSVMSKHLKILEQAEMIERVADGRFTQVRLRRDGLDRVVTDVEMILFTGDDDV